MGLPELPDLLQQCGVAGVSLGIGIQHNKQYRITYFRIAGARTCLLELPHHRGWFVGLLVVVLRFWGRWASS